MMLDDVSRCGPSKDHKFPSHWSRARSLSKCLISFQKSSTRFSCPNGSSHRPPSFAVLGTATPFAMSRFVALLLGAAFVQSSAFVAPGVAVGRPQRSQLRSGSGRYEQMRAEIPQEKPGEMVLEFWSSGLGFCHLYMFFSEQFRRPLNSDSDHIPWKGAQFTGKPSLVNFSQPYTANGGVFYFPWQS